MNYFEYFNPFEEKQRIYGRITRFEKVAEKGLGEYFIDMSLINDKMASFDDAVFSREGIVQSLISRRNNPSREELDENEIWYRQNREHNHFQVLQELYGPELNDYNVHDIFVNHQEVLSRVIPNVRPYIFRLEGGLRPQNKSEIEFLQLCMDLQLYIEMELVSVRENPNNNESQLNDHLLFGSLIFGASPLITSDAALKINYKRERIRKTKDELDISQLKDGIINQSNLFVLEDMLNAMMPASVHKVDFTCFNVGCGLNTNIKIYDHAGKRTFIKYDIGTSTDPKIDKVDNLDDLSLKELGEVPDAVIISHWHCDHIMGIQYCDNSDILKSKWIVPDIFDSRLTVSNYAKRLCISIYLNEQYDLKRYLYFISNCFNDKAFYSRAPIGLYRTKEKITAPNRSFNNNSGLVMVVANKNKNLLLTGDSNYNNLPDFVINKRFYFLVVPHHGGKNTTLNIKSACHCSLGRPCYLEPICLLISPRCSRHEIVEPSLSTAIIPVGAHERYKHPDGDHERELREEGFHIEYTNEGDKSHSF